jgi:hypothetical protein
MNELISKVEAIKALTDYFEDALGHCDSDSMCLFLKWNSLSDLFSEVLSSVKTIPGWISVKDRYPNIQEGMDDSDWVIVNKKSPKFPVAYVAKLIIYPTEDGSLFYSWMYDDCIKSTIPIDDIRAPTFWMEDPISPEDEE